MLTGDRQSTALQIATAANLHATGDTVVVAGQDGSAAEGSDRAASELAATLTRQKDAIIRSPEGKECCLPFPVLPCPSSELWEMNDHNSS